MYEALFTSIEIPTENNDEVYGYELVLQKSVDAYYKVLLSKSAIFAINFNHFHLVGCAKANVSCRSKNGKTTAS